MAIDSRDKRASCLGLALAFRLVLPVADGAIGAADRQQAAYGYSGGTGDVTPPPPPAPTLPLEVVGGAMNAYRPATAIPIATGTGDLQGVAAATGLRLMGYAVRESAGTPGAAAVNLRHGTTSGDPLLVPLELAANASDMRWLGPQGIACPNGIFVDRVSGETELTLFTITTPGVK